MAKTKTPIMVFAVEESRVSKTEEDGFGSQL